MARTEKTGTEDAAPDACDAAGAGDEPEGGAEDWAGQGELDLSAHAPAGDGTGAGTDADDEIDAPPPEAAPQAGDAEGAPEQQAVAEEARKRAATPAPAGKRTRGARSGSGAQAVTSERSPARDWS